MLGYVTTKESGLSDRLLAALADELLSEGVAVVGAVQINTDAPGGTRCTMELQILTGGDRIKISQNLGALSKGCRLDPAGLEEAVGLVAAAIDGPLAARPQLLIVNKFGKQEVEGRGFRPVIGAALAADIPVIVAVSGGNAPGFFDFAGEMAEAIAPEVSALRDWARQQIH